MTCVSKEARCLMMVWNPRLQGKNAVQLFMRDFSPTCEKSLSAPTSALPSLCRPKTTSEVYQRCPRKICTPCSPKPAQTVRDASPLLSFIRLASCWPKRVCVCVCLRHSGVCPGEDAAAGPRAESECIGGARAALLRRVQRHRGGDRSAALRSDHGQHRPAAGPVET